MIKNNTHGQPKEKKLTASNMFWQAAGWTGVSLEADLQKTILRDQNVNPIYPSLLERIQ